MTNTNPRLQQLERTARSAAWLLAVLSDRRSAPVLADAKSILRAELDALGLLAPYMDGDTLRVPEPSYSPDYYKTAGRGDESAVWPTGTRSWS